MGRLPSAEAIARCQEVLSRAADDRRASSITEVALAYLEAMRGNSEAARIRYRRSRALLEEFGYRFFAALTSQDSASIEMFACDLGAAERELRKDYQTLELMGQQLAVLTSAGQTQVTVVGIDGVTLTNGASVSFGWRSSNA